MRLYSSQQLQEDGSVSPFARRGKPHPGHCDPLRRNVTAERVNSELFAFILENAAAAAVQL